MSEPARRRLENSSVTERRHDFGASASPTSARCPSVYTGRMAPERAVLARPPAPRVETRRGDAERLPPEVSVLGRPGPATPPAPALPDEPKRRSPSVGRTRRMRSQRKRESVLSRRCRGERSASRHSVLNKRAPRDKVLNRSTAPDDRAGSITAETKNNDVEDSLHRRLSSNVPSHTERGEYNRSDAPSASVHRGESLPSYSNGDGPISVKKSSDNVERNLSPVQSRDEPSKTEGAECVSLNRDDKRSASLLQAYRKSLQNNDSGHTSLTSRKENIDRNVDRPRGRRLSSLTERKDAASQFQKEEEGSSPRKVRVETPDDHIAFPNTAVRKSNDSGLPDQLMYAGNVQRGTHESACDNVEYPIKSQFDDGGRPLGDRSSSAIMVDKTNERKSPCLKNDTLEERTESVNNRVTGNVSAFLDNFQKGALRKDRTRFPYITTPIGNKSSTTFRQMVPSNNERSEKQFFHNQESHTIRGGFSTKKVKQGFNELPSFSHKPPTEPSRSTVTKKQKECSPSVKAKKCSTQQKFNTGRTSKTKLPLNPTFKQLVRERYIDTVQEYISNVHKYEEPGEDTDIVSEDAHNRRRIDPMVMCVKERSFEKAMEKRRSHNFDSSTVGVKPRPYTDLACGSDAHKNPPDSRPTSPLSVRQMHTGRSVNTKHGKLTTKYNSISAYVDRSRSNTSARNFNTRYDDDEGGSVGPDPGEKRVSRRSPSLDDSVYDWRKKNNRSVSDYRPLNKEPIVMKKSPSYNRLSYIFSKKGRLDKDQSASSEKEKDTRGRSQPSAEYGKANASKTSGSVGVGSARQLHTTGAELKQEAAKGGSFDDHYSRFDDLAKTMSYSDYLKKGEAKSGIKRHLHTRRKEQAPQVPPRFRPPPPEVVEKPILRKLDLLSKHQEGKVKDSMSFADKFYKMDPEKTAEPQPDASEVLWPDEVRTDTIEAIMEEDISDRKKAEVNKKMAEMKRAIRKRRGTTSHRRVLDYLSKDRKGRTNQMKFGGAAKLRVSHTNKTPQSFTIKYDPRSMKEGALRSAENVTTAAVKPRIGEWKDERSEARRARFTAGVLREASSKATEKMLQPQIFPRSSMLVRESHLPIMPCKRLKEASVGMPNVKAVPHSAGENKLTVMQKLKKLFKVGEK